MIAIAFQVPGRPVTWQRGVKGVRLDARGKIAKDYRQKVHLFAMQALGLARRAGVVWPDVRENHHAFRVDVAGWWPDRNEGDEDRMVSLVRDALEGVLYKSDRQVKASKNAVGPTCEAGAEGLVVVVRVLSELDRETWASSVMTDASGICASQAIARQAVRR